MRKFQLASFSGAHRDQRRAINSHSSNFRTNASRYLDCAHVNADPDDSEEKAFKLFASMR